MPQREPLITIEKITDCSTGDYQVGELDFGIHVGQLEDYLKRYGFKGRTELLAMLGYMSYEVQRRFLEISHKNCGCEQAKS